MYVKVILIAGRISWYFFVLSFLSGISFSMFSNCVIELTPYILDLIISATKMVWGMAAPDPKSLTDFYVFSLSLRPNTTFTK